jgi:hypothetical protein
LAGAVLVAACTAVEPQVGILLPQCAAPNQPPAAAYGYGASAPAATGDAGAAATCDPDAGDPCDACEGAKCCEVHLACEGDSLCACADSVLDDCLNKLGPAKENRADPGVRQCWDAFVAASPVTRAYADCERAACADVCAVP